MTELSEQLRTYIDAIAAPVDLDEVRARRVATAEEQDVLAEACSPRRPARRVGVAALAAVLVLLMVAVVLVVRSDDGDAPSLAARPTAHGQALTVVGSEPCTDELAGGTLALGARLSDGSRVCVVERPTGTEVFATGHRPYNTGFPMGTQPFVPLFLTNPRTDHLTEMINVGPQVATVRFTFCDGTIIDAPPFAGPTGARFAGLDSNASRYGKPGSQLLDAAGRTLSATAPAFKPFAKFGTATECRAPRLNDQAPNWSSTPVAVNGVNPAQVTRLAADETTVVVATTDFGSPIAAPQAVIAAGPTFGSLSAVTPGLGNVNLDTLFAWKGGFVTSGHLTPPATNPMQGSPPQRAAIWASPDGVHWSAAGSAPFTAVKHGKAGYESRVVGIAEHDGLLVAVGGYQTHSPRVRQCCGLSPAIWTSRDGVHWHRHILDLGDEFDPYQESIVWFHGQWVATGRSGRFPLVVWTSEDLVHWDHRVIAQHASGQVTVAGGALYLVGGIWAGTKADPRGTPVMWRSTDAVQWERVLSLPSQSVNAERQGIGPVFSANGVLVAAGGGPSLATVDSANVLYESLDGRHWATMPSPFPAGTRITAIGVVREQPTFIVAGAGATTAWTSSAEKPRG